MKMLGKTYEKHWRDVNETLTVAAIEARKRADASLERIVSSIRNNETKETPNEIHFSGL